MKIDLRRRERPERRRHVDEPEAAAGAACHGRPGRRRAHEGAFSCCGLWDYIHYIINVAIIMHMA